MRPSTAFRLALAAMLGLVVLPLVALATRPAPEAAAHPLGNFTVNRYARIDLTADAVSLRYVIDMAEIPAFTEIRAIDRDGDGSLSDAESRAYLTKRLPELLRGIDLRLGGSTVSLSEVSSELSTPAGQGGLSTLRLVADFHATPPAGWQSGIDASFSDSNFSDRIGWREVVVRGGDGVSLLASSALSDDLTNELTAYPESRLQSPPDVREARFRFAAGTTGSTAVGSLPAPAPATNAAPGRSLDRFARLVSEQNLTPAFVALSLLAAMAWGAAHALGPGHGKTIVAAYLVGSRGTARHAIILGLTVTATHTSTVIGLGLVTLYASRFLNTQDLYLWLSVASGLFVAALGGGLFAARLRRLLAPWTHGRAYTHNSVRHTHDAESNHGHSHNHLTAAPGLRGLIALGVSGGLLPCPTALVVMLGAIAIDRVAYGLVLVLAFSVGLAGVLTTIGIVLVYARRALDGSGRLARIAGGAASARWLQALPIGSALVILVVGLILTGRALSDVL